MSSHKFYDEDSDSENRITEKLKSTGRISLSDITAATIGPLDADTWDADQSDSSTNIQTSVHRPWTNISDKEQVTEVKTDTTADQGTKPSLFLSVEPLQSVSAKRGLQDDFDIFQKRIRLEKNQKEQTSDVPSFQKGKNDNSKQLDFTAILQSTEGSENYSAMTSAIKSGAGLTPMSNMPAGHPVNSHMDHNLMPWPWAPTKNERGLYVTSIPVGKFAYSNSSATATFQDPVLSSSETKFQPWTNSDSPLGQSGLLTPIRKTTPLIDTGLLSQSQQYGSTTPMNPNKLAMNNYQPSTDSPGFDSRFNDSLTNLLGSPPTERPISKNPFFTALQDVLESDCKPGIVPKSLMNIHPDKQMQENIFTRERNLHERFNALQESSADDVRQLSGFYRYQSALIETERFRTLHECNYPLSYKDTVNKHYDDKLHAVMDRVEQSILLLENANKENKLHIKGNKQRPHLNKEAVKIMETWFEQNLNHPYPSSATYDMLALQGNVSVEQAKKWFANKRNRTHNTRSLTEIAMKKRKLSLLPGTNGQ